MKALQALLALGSSLAVVAPVMAGEAPTGTKVYGKVLMADCSGALVRASASNLKNHCVVVYSGVWTKDIDGGATLDPLSEMTPDGTEQASAGRTIAQSAEGNFAFAPQELDVLSFIGKNAVLEITETSVIKSLTRPE
jgi:hypothetical protein